MAEVVGGMDFPSRGKYPWDEWTDGQVRRLRKGQDFQCDTRSMQAYIYLIATRRGMKGRTVIEDDDTIIIQFVKE